MKTYQITEQDIANMPILATGYKMFNNDWTTKHGEYDYKDKDGNVIGTIHKADGALSECDWGLHFSEKSHDCFSFYECVQWNKFAKVEAYGEIIKNDKKTVANIIKIVETYTFEDFINIVKRELQSNNINGGDNIRGGSYIWGGNNINGGSYIWGSSNINGGNHIVGGNNINGGNSIWGSNNIRGCNYIIGGNNLWGARNCEGISMAIFCFNKSGKLMAFNKKITETRFTEIWKNLNKFNWYPRFNNAETLKGNLEWYETNIPAIVPVPNDIAWSFMPAEMKAYIQSLPEYNERIFNKVTGK